MSKAVVFLGSLLVMVGLFVNAGLGHQLGTQPSDHELMQMYLTEVHGNGDYDVFIQDGTNDEVIYYIAYDKGVFTDCGSVNRDECKAKAGVDW